MHPRMHFSVRATLVIACGIFLTTKMNQLLVVRIYSVEVMTLLNFVVEILFAVFLSTTDSQTLCFWYIFFSQKIIKTPAKLALSADRCPIAGSHSKPETAVKRQCKCQYKAH